MSLNPKQSERSREIWSSLEIKVLYRVTATINLSTTVLDRASLNLGKAWLVDHFFRLVQSSYFTVQTNEVKI